MIRSKRYKYCLYDEGDFRESLFDMEKDPGETKNLARHPEHHEALLRHRQWMSKHLKSIGDPFPGPSADAIGRVDARDANT